MSDRICSYCPRTCACVCVCSKDISRHSRVKMQLKWGIVGPGGICQDFCLALLTCDAQEHAIVAVGSRSKELSEKFVNEFSLSDCVRTYGSQEEVWQDPSVDIVYIGTIEQVHRDLCVKALQKKHVLCEKLLAINEGEAREIVEAAKKSKKSMREAIWSRFFPVYDHLREAVKQIGTLNQSEIIAPSSLLLRRSLSRNAPSVYQIWWPVEFGVS